MAQQLSELIQTLHPSPKLSPKEELESFSHINLTEEEEIVALIGAKKAKEIRLEEAERQLKIEANRRLYTGTIWTWDQMEQFMRYRAVKLFNGKFNFDGQSALYFQLLVRYFSRDEQFFVLAKQMEIPNPSLDKGLYLGGNFGVGKTWLMKLFQKNQLQVYTLQNAKAIADMFEREGDESMQQFAKSPLLPSNDIENFNHRHMGLCIDDLGTEDVKNHYGNKKNVIGDIIELRYSNGDIGNKFHVTTNLTGEQLTSFYGGRVASRLRECMNIIDFIGSDLRK